MKFFTFNDEKCFFYISEYVDKGKTYIEIDNEDGEIMCDVTVNLISEVVSGKEYAYVDTCNTPGLEQFLTENSFATKLSSKKRSGYNTYNLYKLNLDKINEYGIRR